jgi:hypothetical protein
LGESGIEQHVMQALCTIRMLPMLSVTRKLPSGKSAIDQGEVSLAVMISTLTGGDGFDGAGASVWPGKAGFGFLATSPE